MANTDIKKTVDIFQYQLPSSHNNCLKVSGNVKFTQALLEQGNIPIIYIFNYIYIYFFLIYIDI